MRESTMWQRKKILKHNDGQLKDVWVAEWNEQLYCRVISGRERQQFIDRVFAIDEDGNREPATNEVRIQCTLIALAYCDDNGERVFLDEDIEELEQKNWLILQRLFKIAQEHNRLTAQSVEELEKNFDSSQSDDSGSN